MITKIEQEERCKQQRLFSYVLHVKLYFEFNLHPIKSLLYTKSIGVSLLEKAALTQEHIFLTISQLVAQLKN